MTDMIKVDANRVRACANNIATYNSSIRDDFSSVEKAIKSLDNDWVGSASSNAMNAFFDIKNAYYTPRYQVVNNYVKFLRVQVDDGYTEAETANKTLADEFK